MAVFRIDPCGIICMLITYSAVLYADYVVIFHIAIPTMSDSLLGAINVLLFNLVTFMIIASHLRAVLSDPGIVPLPKTNLDFSDLHSGQKKSEMENSGWTVCMKCETYRPPRAHHCRICRRCIRKMDHHCPWINNCVGEYNQKFFLQFLFYVGVASVYSMVLVGTSWLIDPTGQKHGQTQSRIVHCIILIVESILFGLFVLAIGCDQTQAILSDETGIEQLKKEGSRRLRPTKTTLMAEVCGRGPKYLWLCPLQFVPPEIETYNYYNV